MTTRTPVGGEGERFYKQLPDEEGKAKGRWRAAVWVRDRDGERRLVQATAVGKQAANRALERRLEARNPAGSVGVRPTMTMRELGAYWMTRRHDEAVTPVEGQKRGRRGPVSPQTLAGYQSALTHLVYPLLGSLRLHEVTVGIVDEVLRECERAGRSTGQARTVLSQMFSLAVRHGAIPHNPMRDVDPARSGPGEVAARTVPEARDLLTLLRAHALGEAMPKHRLDAGRGRKRTPDLYEVLFFQLATGCRIGEALALTWGDVALVGEQPTVRIAATMVEPRKHPDRTDSRGNVIEAARVFVDQHHRQPITKSGGSRTLLLPAAAVELLSERRKRTMWRRVDDPVFASRSGGHLMATNLRTKLRGVVKGTVFEGTSTHTMRKTVGTLVAHEAGIDVARDVLGHADSSVTGRFYVAPRAVAPDVRDLLDRFFSPGSPGTDAAAN